MKSYGIEDDLKVQIDDNFENSRSFELNNINNIGVGTSSDTNNPFNDNDIDEYLRNNEKDKDNEVSFSFSLHDTSADCLF